MCAALSSYARACAAKGVMLWGWRERVCSECFPTGCFLGWRSSSPWAGAGSPENSQSRERGASSL